MDDPDEDWEIEKQTNCEYLEGDGGCKSNLRWILEKGLNVGKKVVITGVVMSSAPVVLPQVFVVSAVGFAFSVPLGLAYTGYACTLNLMSKLLPIPTEFPVFEDETEEVEGRGEGKYRIESRDYVEGEEKEQMYDLRAGVEGRIELVRNENEAPREEVDSEGIRRDDELRVASENSGLKKQGYEEGDDEPVVGNNESSVEMVTQVDVGQDESVNQERKREELLPKEDALKNSDMPDFREGEGEWGATESEVEGEGDMGREESIKEDTVGDLNDGMEKEEMELTIEETEPVRNDGKDEVKPEVGKKENIRAVLTGVFGECSKNQTRVNDEEDIKRGSVGLLEKIKDEGHADDIAKRTKNKKKKNKKKTGEESAEMPLPDVEVQSVISKNLLENLESVPEERKKLEDSSKVGMQQGPGGTAAGSHDLIPPQKNVASSYPGESEESSGRDSMPMGKVDSIEILSRTEATDGGTSSAVDSVLPTEKELVDEKKIWEQIDALRNIVGYKATPHRSSIEEVKALYVFAGVELPASFGNQPDVAELNNKLRFLMSIVGVKGKRLSSFFCSMNSSK